MFLALPQRASIDAFLNCLTRLSLPLPNGYAVLLLDRVSVAFRDHVECAERYDPQVRAEVVYVTSLQPLLIVIVFVHEMHHAQEQRPVVERAQRVVVMLYERVEEKPAEAEPFRLLILVDEGADLRDNAC